MDSNNSNKTELEEKAKKIDQIYQDSKSKVSTLGERAISLLKDIRKKREQKKVEDISKELRG